MIHSEMSSQQQKRNTETETSFPKVGQYKGTQFEITNLSGFNVYSLFHKFASCRNVTSHPCVTGQLINQLTSRFTPSNNLKLFLNYFAKSK